MDAHLITGPLSRESAALMFNLLAQRAQALGLSLRLPPPEPTGCCGRGCNGCVWEGFFDAAIFWRQDALQAIESQKLAPAICASPCG